MTRAMGVGMNCMGENYYISCLTSTVEKEAPIGIWVRRYLMYLKKHRRGTYTNLFKAAD